MKNNITQSITEQFGFFGTVVKLNPWFITGFTDAESTFTISITKDNRTRKTTRRIDFERIIYVVHPSFAISLNFKDNNFLYNLQSYFGVGKIKNDLQHNAIVYYVNSIQDLTNVIIPHFEKYPLLTQKHADFLLFKQVVNLMNDKAHLTSEGLAKILALKASMNNGLSGKLKEFFPNIAPVPRPLVENQEILDPN
jgi:hypothetical protein